MQRGKLYRLWYDVCSLMIRKRYRQLALVALVIGVFLAIGWYLSHTDIAVLNPQGAIAQQQYNLIVFGTILSLIVIIPVFIMTFLIVRKYRVDKHGNYMGKKGHRSYAPDWDGSRRLETIWWGGPLLIILVLAIVTWQSSHALDPSKPISSTVTNEANKPAMKVQVIALQWRWLFIYPEQGVASVNYLQIPDDTPVNFEITADSAMNSFWIPKLGGQIYAMSGMSTHLNLIADKPGEYRGVSANLSGKGFADMRFRVRAVPSDEFADWVQTIKRGDKSLNLQEYERLSRPSADSSYAFYNSDSDGPGVDLYSAVMGKYMSASSSREHDQMTHGSGMDPAHDANNINNMTQQGMN